MRATAADYRAALESGDARSATPSARTWPRTALRALQRRCRRRRRSTRRCRCSDSAGARSYLGVPLELSDGTRVGALAAVSRRRNAFTDCRRAAVRDAGARARVRARARESNAARPAQVQRHAARSGPRDGRDRPRGPGTRGGRRCPPGGLRGGLPRSRTRRSRSCSSRRVATSSSTAMAGVEGSPPVTSSRAAKSRRAAAARAPPRRPTSSPTRAAHPALAAPLVEATSARSAVFEPVLRDGQVSRRADRCGIRQVPLLRDRAARHAGRRAASCWPRRPPSRSSTRACAPA